MAGRLIPRPHMRTLRLLLRRLLAAIPTLLLTAVGAFALLEAAPGDAVDAYLTQTGGGDAGFAAALRARLGLEGTPADRPGRFLLGFAGGEFGTSAVFNRPVLAVILERMPVTLLLMGGAIALAALAGTALGLLAGARPGSLRGRALSAAALGLLAVPNFWLGLLLILLFAVRLPWLPVGGLRSLGGPATPGFGAAVATVALLAGAAVGATAGYLGDAANELLMRLADATQTVPSFALALASVAGPSRPAVVAALAAAAWTGPARVVRAEVLSLRTRPFVEASRLIGRHPLAVAFGVVLPNALSPLFALAAVIVAGAILAESALSFLGLGDPNAPSWGAMIAEGRAVLRTAPHVIIAPGLAVMLTVLAVSLVGESLAKALAARDDGGG